MRTPIRLEYRAQPSLLAFVSQVWRPSHGFSGDGKLPDIQAQWRGQRASPRQLADYFGLSGLPAGEQISILYPHTVSFPMLMAVLSHPAFPLPIWKVLQVRNRLTQHEPIAPDAVLDFTVRTGERRVLEKGVEMDIHVTAETGGRIVWEGVNTFYARGRFGTVGAAEAAAPSSPAVAGEARADWQMPAHGCWRYGRLSGDINPLHMNNWYARRSGYAGAFAHPQRVIGQCLGHLGTARHAPMQLETWIKGPVFYGARVSLRAESQSTEQLFALHVEDDARPAIVGRFVTPNANQKIST
ncbi:MAG: MaoC family dehydratase [Sulfuritalea sp.]|nr:MaoC family dehydratase [Sulfuritalea sp.]